MQQTIRKEDLQSFIEPYNSFVYLCIDLFTLKMHNQNLVVCRDVLIFLTFLIIQY